MLALQRMIEEERDMLQKERELREAMSQQTSPFMAKSYIGDGMPALDYGRMSAVGRFEVQS